MASNFPEVGGLLVELVDLSWFSNPTSSLWVLLPSISGGACGLVDLSWFSNPTSCLWDLLLSISWCAVSLFEQCTSTGCHSVGVLFRCSSSVPLLV
jgi:hypothetical protein